MNPLLKKLFETIRNGSPEEQNDAIAALVEVLRRNYLRGMEGYAFVSLQPSDALFTLTLSKEEKNEIFEEIDSLIHSENNSSPRRASLLWALGSSMEWKSLESLLKFLRVSNDNADDNEAYQALCSIENLLCLGEEDSSKMSSLLTVNHIRQILEHHASRNKIGLPELIVSITRQIDRFL